MESRRASVLRLLRVSVPEDPLGWLRWRGVCVRRLCLCLCLCLCDCACAGVLCAVTVVRVSREFQLIAVGRLTCADCSLYSLDTERPASACRCRASGPAPARAPGP